MAHCHIVGNFGRAPVDPSILSADSLDLAAKNGPCLTLAEIPYLDTSGIVLFETVKIFHHPVLHEREKVLSFQQEQLYPNGHHDRTK